MFHWFFLETSEAQGGKERHGATKHTQRAHLHMTWTASNSCPSCRGRLRIVRPNAKVYLVQCQQCGDRYNFVRATSRMVLSSGASPRCGACRNCARAKNMTGRGRRPDCTASGTRRALSIGVAVASHDALPPRDTTLALTASTGLSRPPPVGTQPSSSATCQLNASRTVDALLEMSNSGAHDGNATTCSASATSANGSFTTSRETQYKVAIMMMEASIHAQKSSELLHAASVLILQK